MLERALRLNNSQDISRVYKKGQFANGELFRVKYLRNNLKHPRSTVVIGLKFSKKAVVRNLIKRRVRAYLAQLTDRLNNFDIIIMPKIMDVDRFEYAQITKDLDRVLRFLMKTKNN